MRDELAKNRHELPQCSDADRVAYLKPFVPRIHLQGMTAFAKVYAGNNPKAKEVLLLCMLEAWTAAVQYIVEEYGSPIEEEVADGDTETEVEAEEASGGEEAEAAGPDAEEPAGDEEEGSDTKLTH